MLISDWSSDVCSSDLVEAGKVGAYLSERRADPSWRGCNITIPHKKTAYRLIVTEGAGGLGPGEGDFGAINTIAHDPLTGEIGRASCRERECQDGSIPVGAVSLKKKNITQH